MEIYNERCHDLLDPGSKPRLRVREHKVLGPYVEGLSHQAVSNYLEIEQLLVEGNKSRTVAATAMNSESSRSHAVFTILVTMTLKDSASGVEGERASRVSLVDLAGSERAVKTGASGVGVNGFHKLRLGLDKRNNSPALIGQELLSCIYCPIRVHEEGGYFGEKDYST